MCAPVIGPRRCIVCDRPGPFPSLFDRGGFRLVRCPDCRLVFQDPQPSEEVLAGSYYQDPEFSRALLGPLNGLLVDG